MPRLPRVYLEEAVYFVTLEGPYNESLFRDKADYQKYLELLNKCKAECHFKLFSYALLPNRLYLLIEPNQEFPISHIMQKITPLYTKYYNGQHERRGPLFQKRFRSVIVEKESHLPHLTRYIHLVSLRSQLVENLTDYAYSSYPAFTGRGGNGSNQSTLDLNMKAEMEEVIQKLPELDRVKGYENYALLADNKELEFLDKKLSRGAILGSDQFVSEVKKRMSEYIQKEIIPQETALEEVAQASAIYHPTQATLALSAVLVLTVALSTFSLYLNSQTLEKKVAPVPGILNTAQTAQKVASIGPTAIQPVVLNGTVWEVELISVSPEGVKTPLRDKIKFNGKAFESYYFSNQGFSRSNYTVTVHDGVITWETIQTNAVGETVSWRGDWQGGKMEGMLSFHPVGKNPQDFSFISNQFGVQK